MKLTPKEFKDKLKLTYSSLFARKMPFVVFGCPRHDDNTFFFSNIPLEEMELYEPKTLYYIHKVNIKQTDFLDDLYELFPVLKDTVVIIDTRAMMALINKQKTFEDMTIRYTPEHDVILQVQHEGLKPVASSVIGTVLSEHQSMLYHDTFMSGKVIVEQPYVKELDASLIVEQDICPVPILSIYNTSLDTCRELLGATAPIQEGMSFVATKEYIKNTKDENTKLWCISGSDDRAIKLEFRFESEYVIVESVQPAARWFCNEIKPNVK